MARQPQIVVGNETSDPAVWLDRLAAIYEFVAITLLYFYTVSKKPDPFRLRFEITPINCA